MNCSKCIIGGYNPYRAPCQNCMDIQVKKFIQNQIQEQIYNAFAKQEPEPLMDKDKDFYRKMKSLERRMTNVD